MKKANLKTKMTALVLAVMMTLALLPAMAMNASAAKNKGFIWPTPGYDMSCPFGAHSMCFDGIPDHVGGHGGIDTYAVRGTPILAAHSGYIIEKKDSTDGGYGRYIEIQAENVPNFTGTTLYAHASSLTSKREGEKVTQGEVIGYVGGSGYGSETKYGAHLHFEVWKSYNGTKVNPRDYVDPDDKGGYFPQGCLDSVSGGVGTVTVRGWIFDRDALSKACEVHVYIGGPAGSSNAEGYAKIANKSRSDVNKAYPGVGDYHGFDETITTKKRGTQEVYVYAINIAGTPGDNVLLGSKTVTIESESTPGSITGISIKSLPSKTTYNTNESLNTSGLKLNVKWSDGKTTEATSGYSCSPSSFKNTSYSDISQTVTVTYQGHTATFNVTVKKQSGIIINVNSYYNAGYNYQMTGGSPFSIPRDARVYIRKAVVDPADGILMYEIEYGSQIGWVSSRYLRLE